jgi:hypothetical protein
MMLYLLHGQLPFVESSHSMTADELFYHIRAKKKSHRPSDLCQSDESTKLLDFIIEIFSLKFDEKPYYDKLRFMLGRELTEFNQQPNADIFGRNLQNQKTEIGDNVECGDDVEECPN